MARRTKREIPGQLSMFMTPREITSEFQASDWDRQKTKDVEGYPRPESDEELMSRKLDEAKLTGLYHSIREQGVQMPVHLSHQLAGPQRRGRDIVPGKKEIGEGHHRVASMMDINPDQPIPVLHHETMNDLGMYHMDQEYGVMPQAGTQVQEFGYDDED